VREDWRGTGLAFELLRLSLAGLRDAGTSEVSLTVTEQNTRAVALYERTGFHAVHRFDALVWD
jgi:ribosomal protein S18 acetylase RimI-like enzyme